MKLTFLGTSHGIPEPGRNYTSILVETNGGGAYIFDAGAPVMNLLINKGVDPRRVKEVFITHAHADHCAGLFDMICLSTWFYKDMAYGVHVPEKRISDAIEAYLSFTTPTQRNEKISYDEYKEGVIFDNGDIKVTAFRTAHIRVSYGFIIEADGKRVVFTGDLHPSLDDYPKFLEHEHFDAVITECAHFSPESLLEKLATCSADKLMIIHVGIPQNKLYAELQNAPEKIGKSLVLPNDMDEYLL